MHLGVEWGSNPNKLGGLARYTSLDLHLGKARNESFP